MKQFTQMLMPLMLGIAFMSLNSMPARGAETSKIIATVAGENITQAMFDTYIKRRGVKDLKKINPEEKKAIIEELINRELLYQVALKDKLNEKPLVITELNNIQRNLFAAAAIQQAVTSQGPITEKMIRTEYEKVATKQSGKEYKARHILMEKENEAKTVIVSLDKGAKFADLAKTKSKGPTGKNGGDLGWFRNNQMLPKFTEAVAKLKKGKYTASPVKTQYGWHIILLEDVREVPPPTLAEMTNKIKSSLNNQRLGKYINSLKSNAKITIF